MSELIQPEMLCLKCMNLLPDINEACPNCGFSNKDAAVDQSLLPPYTILKGQYLVGIPMGVGGFGVTYSAYDLVNSQRVAIKELFMNRIVQRKGAYVVLDDTSERGRAFYNECQEKFQQEAVALGALKNKSGVVDISETFRENGTGYIVMEFLEGDNLLVYLKKNGGKITFEKAFQLLSPVMKSMIEIHRTGIIHRDISPDNIIYIPDESMKILDFGSVKFTTLEGQSYVVLKKDGYTPPEQYAKGYLIGPWMDVYAMAATIYRCITGKKPKISIERENDQDLEDPRAYCDDIPEAEVNVLKKGLALRVEERYQDMREFYDALNEALPPGKPESEEGEIPPYDSFADVDEQYMNLIKELEQKKTFLSPGEIVIMGILVYAFIIVLYTLIFTPIN